MLAHIHTQIHTYMHAYINACMHAYIHSYIHTYIRTYIYTYIHTYIHTHTHNITESNVRILTAHSERVRKDLEESMSLTHFLLNTGVAEERTVCDRCCLSSPSPSMPHTLNRQKSDGGNE